MISIASVKRAAFKRLLIAWASLSLVIGGASLYLEIQKVNNLVQNLARTTSLTLLDHIGKVDQTHAQMLEDALRQLLKQNFVRVQLTDGSHQRLAQAVSLAHTDLLSRLIDPSVTPAETAAQGGRMIWLTNAWVLQMNVPLQDADGRIKGHFYGDYQVDDRTRQQAQWELVRNVSLVLLAMLAATLVLYPVINSLTKGVLRLSTDLMHSNIELMEVLGGAIAKRDSDTDLHNYRVCLYSIRFARELGLSEDEIRAVIAGAFLHDVGKIGITDSILLKPGKLNAEEFAVMKTHVQIGVDIIAKSGWLKDARDIIEFHHEHFDGNGYLQGLRGDAIPVAARLFAIVDVFDALTSRRPYKDPFSVDQACRF